MTYKMAVILTFAVVSSGCGRAIKNYVGGSQTTNQPAPATPVSDATSLGIKVTPGANIAAGTTVKSRFSITPTQVTTQGTQVKSTFTFH